MKTTWEYKSIQLAAKGGWVGGKIDTDALEGLLNEHGREGWELVSVFDTNVGGQTMSAIAVFKRPR